MLLFLLVFFDFRLIAATGFVPLEKLNPKLQIETASGIIQGSQETTVLGKTYFRYVGIPYARPPINNYRFRGPKPVTKWTNVLDATKAGPCCASINFTIVPNLEISGSGEEDCLYLNVYTPKEPNKQKTKALLPVMMYVYGGAFFTGCADIYEPDFLIENDVILVTPNYRLAAFGYLSTGDNECPGNWAIKDLIYSLKWIQRNIRQFGGDPNTVTLFGQSSGAANINVILLSPKAKGLFHRVILMSGSSLSYWAYQIDPRKVAFDVGTALGISTNSTKILIEELRKADSKDLIRMELFAIVANLLLSINNGLPFTPTIEPPHKEAILANDFPFNLLERGEFNRVPIMTGVTSMEMFLFKQAFDLLKPIVGILDMSPGLLVRMTEDIRNKSTVGNKIKNFFLPLTGYGRATEEDILKLFTEEAYWRPGRKMSSLVAKYCPVYFYQFSYEGQLGLDMNSIYNGITSRKIKGVGHNEDLYYLFHQRGQARNIRDMQITKKMTKIYTNFAKSGNPTPDVDLLLDNITWPRVGVEKFPYLNMGERFEVINNNFDEENFQFWEELFKIYGQKPYKVY